MKSILILGGGKSCTVLIEYLSAHAAGDGYSITIADADAIFVLEGGRITEAGNGALENALNGKRGQRRLFRRFPDHRIAADQGECGVPGPDGDGEVEGADDAHGADLLSPARRRLIASAGLAAGGLASASTAAAAPRGNDAVNTTEPGRPGFRAIVPPAPEGHSPWGQATASEPTLRPTSVRPGEATLPVTPRAYTDMDGKKGSGNPNGHIIRFREAAGASTATEFTWDIFLFGAEDNSEANNVNLSKLTAANDFSSPDGLWFSPSTGICWIQTDDGSFTDETNCMLLAAIPGEVGDGGEVSINNVGGTVPQKTFLGATLGEARLRRFLVGPKGCEITGLTEADDGKTIFVNIQHPGEGTLALGQAAKDFTEATLESTWPSNAGYGPGKRPRSATIAIRRKDGKPIGL